jgi:hypothetical protein
MFQQFHSFNCWIAAVPFAAQFHRTLIPLLSFGMLHFFHNLADSFHFFYFPFFCHLVDAPAYIIVSFSFNKADSHPTITTPHFKQPIDLFTFMQWPLQFSHCALPVCRIGN